ncbi:MAG TPA: hypothetical protein VLC28_14340 [Flavitalea sp.]|nr:hypothetical protein [Flavitalea sp.]
MLTSLIVVSLSGFINYSSENFFTVAKNKYPLTSLQVANESYGITPKFEIDLITGVSDLGKANTYIFVSLSSDNTADISNGIYQFSSEPLNERLPFSFNGFVKVNKHEVKIFQGTISVENRDNEFDIQFILKLQNGDIAKGTYHGKALKINRNQSYQ